MTPPVRPVRRLLTVASAAALLAGVAGCGGGRTPEPPEPRPTSVVHPPTGDRAGRRPLLALVVVHGGTWRGERDPLGFRQAEQLAPVYQAQGYQVTSVRYRSGTAGLADVRAAVRTSRRRAGAGVPVCLLGWSSGGNLSLLYAAERRDVACVVAKAAPTDLPELGPTEAAARKALGADALDRFSPARVARRIRARVLLQYAVGDPLVPVDQGRRMLRARPSRTRLQILPRGDRPFIHSGVTAAASASALRAEGALYVSVATAAAGR
jgi:dienelactone hydrolase